jgi:lipoprotein-releasing system ATP-binding protein
MSTCQSCHREAETKKVTFVELYGAVLIFVWKLLRGEWCADCIAEKGRAAQRKTMTFGWWSVPTVLLTPLVLLWNNSALSQGKGLKPPAANARRGSGAFLEVKDLWKSYFLHGKRIDVLRSVSLQIEKGELVSLVGASGSGKSTFLHVVGTLDAPAAGSMSFGGRSVFDLNDAEVAEFRNRTIGFVFQSHYLLPEFTAVENVAMPALILRQDKKQAMTRARELIERVGLAHRADHRPGELSGGESQRVALARALMLKPELLLADEPTGNLDPATGEGIHALLREVNRDLGITAIVVTHNEVLARSMPRRLRLKDGQVVTATDAIAEGAGA